MKAEMSNEPGERAPAPEPIRLVQTFINTNDLEGDDRLSDAGALRSWLDAAGLDAPARVTRDDHARAVQLREALRELVSANAGMPYDADAVAVVNRVAAEAGLHAVLAGPAEA